MFYTFKFTRHLKHMSMTNTLLKERSMREKKIDSSSGNLLARLMLI